MESKDYQKQYRSRHLVEERNRDRRRARTPEGRYRQLKSSAKRRGVLFNITFLEYCYVVMLGQCSYCGGSLPEVGFGLDRVDRHQGYVSWNLVSCCKRCNNRKGMLERLGFSPERSIELLKELLFAVKSNTLLIKGS